MKRLLHKNTLLVIGGLAALGAGVSGYTHVKGQKQDRLAALILQKVRQQIRPASAGLQAETAFDLGYKEKVLARVSGRVIVLTVAAAAQKARAIHSAFGSWWQGGDDEDQLYGVFRALKDKVQVSQLATAYYEAYHVNLIDRLHDKLEKAEVRIILDIVRQLPPYRKMETL